MTVIVPTPEETQSANNRVRAPRRGEGGRHPLALRAAAGPGEGVQKDLGKGRTSTDTHFHFI